MHGRPIMTDAAYLEPPRDAGAQGARAPSIDAHPATAVVPAVPAVPAAPALLASPAPSAGDHTLNPSLAHYKALRERICAEHEDIDEETLADTLEGLTDLHEAIAAVVRAVLDDEARAEALKIRIRDMRARCERIENRSKQRRRIAAEAMTEAGLRRILAEDMTLSVRPGSPGLAVTEEAAIPEAFWRPAPPVLDRRALLDRLKAGDVVDGAGLSNPAPVLSVRVK